MQILLTIAYDGTSYAGWQRQTNAVTVQEKVETALEKLIGSPVTLRAASRTDAGVHALGQRASFFVSQDFKIPPEKLPLVLAGLLPSDISVTRAEIVPDSFHPQFDAKQKTYLYKIITAPNPLMGRYAVLVPHELDLLAMQEAAGLFVGKHDFAAFCAAGSTAKTTVREIFGCEVFCEMSLGNVLSYNIKVTGNGFLYNMVRIIAGTLLYVGLGKLSSADIPQIILSKERKNAGKTMPPQGLVLLRVDF